MKNVQRLKLALALGAGLLLGGSSAVLAAGGDSDADASAGFAKQVQESRAVIIKVPINEKGEENTDLAEMRLHSGADLSTSSNLSGAFDAAKPASSEPNVSAADVSKDSSTHGWYGGRGNCGWQPSYYYYSYQPTYYSCGSYYQYYQPYYTNYYTTPNYCGYRYYYYYQRHW